MKIFGLEIRKASVQEAKNTIYNVARNTSGARSNAMLLPAVYRCNDVLSSAVAVLPMKIYEISDGYKREAIEHPLHWLLNQEPNQDMTSFTFKKTLQSSVNLRGNGYAYIERDTQYNISQLIFIPEETVKIVFLPDSTGTLRKRYQVRGFKKEVEPCDMIHLLNFSYDGIKGVSTLTHARQTVSLAAEQEENAQSFFSSGSAMTGVINVEGVGSIKPEKKDEMYAALANRTSKRGGVAILEGNMKYQPISISNSDAQFLESREFTVVDICRFFGVSPVKCFDLSKSSYSTVEATQLQFLSDSLMPLLAAWEQELNRKLITGPDRGRYVIEFDTTAILRANMSDRANFYNTLFNNGAITPNEIRREVNLPPVDGGDEAYIQVNMQKLTEPLQANPEP